MEYEYRDREVQRLCENEGYLRKKCGPAAVKRMELRLNEIEVAHSVADLLEAPQWHTLKNKRGDRRQGQLAGKLTGGLRLILSAPDAGTDAVRVEVREVVDYHD